MKSVAAVITVTIYLIFFTFLCMSGTAINIIPYLFLLSPFLVMAMVLLVLKDNSQSYPELSINEEWGYLDKPKDKLAIF